MDGQLIITIDWIYFLAIMASLLGVAWYSSGRFSKLEEAMGWLKESVRDLKVGMDNQRIRAFEANSPIALTDKGLELLKNSGIKEYIEDQNLLERCKKLSKTNSYEVQEYIFNLFDNLEFDKEYDDKLKKYSYEQGVSMDVIRRVGAIYLRDKCLEQFHMDIKDIDKNNPKIENETKPNKF